MHKRIGAIINKQIRALERSIRKRGRGARISGEDAKTLKTINDALDDHIRLGRLLEQDDEKAAETLSDRQLEAIADGKNLRKTRRSKAETTQEQPEQTQETPDDTPENAL
jgi:hypothetical protein